MVSVSEINTYNTCPQKHNFTYVQGLRPVQQKDKRLNIGTAFHVGMAELLMANMHAETPEPVLTVANLAIDKWVNDMIDELGSFSIEDIAIGYSEAAYGIAEIGELAKVLVRRTYEHHDRFKHLHVVCDKDDNPIVEYKINLSKYWMDFVGYVDVVFFNENTGYIELWDWKTRGGRNNFYEYRDIQLDNQLAVYAYVLNAMGIEVDAAVQAQILAVEPRKPRTLTDKDGNVTGLSRDKRINTDWETYQQSIAEHGFDESDYQDMKEILQVKEFFREVSIFYTKETLDQFWLHFSQSFHRVLNQHGQLVKVLNHSCKYCPFTRLCHAEISGGDVDSLLNYEFEKVDLPSRN